MYSTNMLLELKTLHRDKHFVIALLYYYISMLCLVSCPLAHRVLYIIIPGEATFTVAQASHHDFI
jgi:hypothetical protein